MFIQVQVYLHVYRTYGIYTFEWFSNILIFVKISYAILVLHMLWFQWIYSSKKKKISFISFFSAMITNTHRLQDVGKDKNWKCDCYMFKHKMKLIFKQTIELIWVLFFVNIFRITLHLHLFSYDSCNSLLITYFCRVYFLGLLGIYM